MTLIIFLPSFLYKKKCGYLQGAVYSYPEDNIKTIVVYGKLVETAENGSIRYSVWENLDTVGYFFSGANSNLYFVPRKSDWLSVGINYGEFVIKEALCSSTNVPAEEHRLFIYDKCEFLKSELLAQQLDLGDNNADCFRTLTHSLETAANLSSYSSPIFTVFETVLFFILHVADLVLRYSSKVQPLLKFSALAIQFHQFFKNISWVLTTILKDKKLNLKSGNFLLAFIADILGGTVILYYLANVVSMEDVINFICDTSEVYIGHLCAPYSIEVYHNLFSYLLNGFYLLSLVFNKSSLMKEVINTGLLRFRKWQYNIPH